MTIGRLAWFILAVSVCAAFIGLGHWQWQRGAEKDALQARLADAAQRPAVGLAQALERAEQIRYSKVRVVGVMARPTVYLDNQIRQGRVGVLVFNPLRIAGSDAELLVVRGWRPLADGVRALPEADVPSERLTLEGFLDQPPAAGLSLGSPPGSVENDDPLLVTRIDPIWLAEQWQRPLLPWVLYLDAQSPAGYLRDWQPHYLPPERHRGYALQWWGLAAATLIIYVVLSWRHSTGQRPTGNTEQA